MSTSEVGELLYTVTLNITGIKEYGVSFAALMAGELTLPGEGARFDVPFEGTAAGPKLNGTVEGIDYVRVRADGNFDLERIECQAACTHAPVMTVDWEFFDRMTPADALDVLDRLAAGEEVASTRGPIVRGFRAAERTISGIDDDGLTDAGPNADELMLASVRAAAERGVPAADGGRRP